MLTIFLSGISPIPFGLDGLILPAIGFMGPGILAVANQKLDTGTSNEELEEIYAVLTDRDDLTIGLIIRLEGGASSLPQGLRLK